MIYHLLLVRAWVMIGTVRCCAIVMSSILYVWFLAGAPALFLSCLTCIQLTISSRYPRGSFLSPSQSVLVPALEMVFLLGNICYCSCCEARLIHMYNNATCWESDTSSRRCKP